MIAFICVGYLLFGIITLVFCAYDPFTKTYDFGFSDGWEFFFYQRYLFWLIILIFSPFFFVREILKKTSDRKYVKEWRKKGHFTRKL